MLHCTEVLQKLVEMGHERPIGTALPMSPIHLIATARAICRAVAKCQLICRRPHYALV